MKGEEVEWKSEDARTDVQAVPGTLLVHACSRPDRESSGTPALTRTHFQVAYPLRILDPVKQSGLDCGTATAVPHAARDTLHGEGVWYGFIRNRRECFQWRT